MLFDKCCDTPENTIVFAAARVACFCHIRVISAFVAGLYPKSWGFTLSACPGSTLMRVRMRVTPNRASRPCGQ
jgi:hypothetical protein